MEGMDHGHMGSPPSAAMSDNKTMAMGGSHKMASMHMTFFWGSNAQILFSGWPGSDRPGMYVLSLIFVFALAVLVEFLSHCRLIKYSSSAASRRVGAGLAQTLLHALRVGLAYLVMLALMSFNGGVFLVAVAGHAVGFLAFGSRLFRSVDTEKVASDLPPMSTC